VRGAVDLRVADNGKRARTEERTQITIALPADAAEPHLAAARVLFGNEPYPGREVAPGSEGLGIGNGCNQGGREGWADARKRIESLRGFARSMPGYDAPVEIQYLRLQKLQLLAECYDASARDFRNASVARIGGDLNS